MGIRRLDWGRRRLDVLREEPGRSGQKAAPNRLVSVRRQARESRHDLRVILADPAVAALVFAPAWSFCPALIVHCSPHHCARRRRRRKG